MSIRLSSLNPHDKFLLENSEDVPEDEKQNNVYMKLARQGYELNSVSLVTARLYAFGSLTMVNPVGFTKKDIDSDTNLLS